MGLPFQKQAEQAQEPLTDKLISITFSDTPYAVPQKALRIGVDTTDGITNVVMPPPEEAAGNTIEVYVDTFTSNCTINGPSISEITLDAVDEYSTLYSTGKDWREVDSNHA